MLIWKKYVGLLFLTGLLLALASKAYYSVQRMPGTKVVFECGMLPLSTNTNLPTQINRSSTTSLNPVGLTTLNEMDLQNHRSLSENQKSSLGSGSFTFQEDFNKGLSSAWKWLDEDPAAWNLDGGCLNVRRYPGHGFYSSDNNKVPVLYLPSIPLKDGVVAQVKVGFNVDKPYGQAGFIWFYDNNNYAKYIIEYFFNEGVHNVFLQEENGVPCKDGACTKVYPYQGNTSVELRMTYQDGKFFTQFRKIGESNWTSHFVSDAIPNNGNINIGLFSQADSGSSEWAWFNDFQLIVP